MDGGGRGGSKKFCTLSMNLHTHTVLGFIINTDNANHHLITNYMVAIFLRNKVKCTLQDLMCYLNSVAYINNHKQTS